MHVAVKLLRKVHLGDDNSMSEEFEREIEFMQQTRHANIVRFFGTGTMTGDGTPFLVEASSCDSLWIISCNCLTDGQHVLFG